MCFSAHSPLEDGLCILTNLYLTWVDNIQHMLPGRKKNRTYGKPESSNYNRHLEAVPIVGCAQKVSLIRQNEKIVWVEEAKEPPQKKATQGKGKRGSGDYLHPLPTLGHVNVPSSTQQESIHQIVLEHLWCSKHSAGSGTQTITTFKELVWNKTATDVDRSQGCGFRHSD